MRNDGFQAIVEGCPEGIGVASSGAGRLHYVNQAFARLVGRRAEDLLGTRLAELIVPEERAAHEEEAERTLATGIPSASRCERRLLRREGGEVLIEAHMSRTLLDGDVALLFVGRDLGERREMNRRIMIADRMSSVGTLAAGVAHEINNPLAYVIANLGYVEEELAVHQARVPGAAELLGALREAREGGERIRDIVRDLKTFSRASGEECSTVDVRTVVELAIGMAWNELRHRARLVRDFHATPPVAANEGRMAQALLNLLVNAAHAIPEGQADENEIRVSIGMRAGRVEIEIRDTGCGISRENLGRIFDPFFTTKPVGVGSGLGLSITHGIVTQMGGEIAVTSEPGRWTSARVTLPAEPAARGAAPTPTPIRALKREELSGRVLVIDDEPAIGHAVRRALGGAHEVVSVTRARQALERLLAGEPFDLVLCDVMMPEMTGVDLYAQLAAHRPELAAEVVFMTGGAFTPGAQAFLERVENRRIDKPFDLPALRAMLQDRLRSRLAG